ncbi:cytochrome P450 [Coniochaeta sp. 2T2.1]|nr:cytochrome P450 [Coniochaeta sp. 2T2.1]
MTKAMLLVAFDNIGKVGFSREFGTTTEGEGTKWLDHLEAFFTLVARLGGLPWPPLIVKSTGVMGDVTELEKISVDIVEDRLMRDHPGMEDLLKYFIKDFRSEKPKSYFNKFDLYVEAGVVLIAATETSAATMAWIFYYLTKHPEVRRKLTEEIKPAFGQTIHGEFTDADLARVEYLTAVHTCM